MNINEISFLPYSQASTYLYARKTEISTAYRYQKHIDNFFLFPALQIANIALNFA